MSKKIIYKQTGRWALHQCSFSCVLCSLDPMWDNHHQWRWNECRSHACHGGCKKRQCGHEVVAGKLCIVSRQSLISNAQAFWRQNDGQVGPWISNKQAFSYYLFLDACEHNRRCGVCYWDAIRKLAIICGFNLHSAQNIAGPFGEWTISLANHILAWDIHTVTVMV